MMAHPGGASPLKIFGLAKKKITDIFTDISNYLTEVQNFVSDTKNCSIVTAEDKNKISGYSSRVSGIWEVISRDHMKVVFFGRTSNGKSTVINAMLRSKILPSGMGHTTNCFIQVEGCDNAEGYVLTEDSTEQKHINSIRELANALSSFRLRPNSLIRICWPKEKCSLLRDDVVLVDSPGIDVSPDLDSWIDKFCLDADVFVLVANAESTLMQTEKNFFLKVSDRLSKPNVFILNNRWDNSVLEPDSVEQVRQQHLERSTEFLCNELRVIHKADVEDRVFFVSAREALASRSEQSTGSTPTTPSMQLAEGSHARLFAFANFERKFEECISRSAVKTKFAQHTKKGEAIVQDLRAAMDGLIELGQSKREQLSGQRGQLMARLSFIEKQLDMRTGQIRTKIAIMVEEVQSKVSHALNEEIKRLFILVDEFDRPFHPDQLVLTSYKKELHAHVEQGLGRNLQARYSAALREEIEQTEKEMDQYLRALLPEDRQAQAVTLIPNSNFSVAYQLDCRNLCADFQEDISFKFSLGVTSLVGRFLGKRGAHRALHVLHGGQQPVLQPAAAGGNPEPPFTDHLMTAVIGAFPSLVSSTTMGTIIVTGLVTKAAGWKVIAICGSLYGLLYLYERLMWTRKAKERAFKSQYVDFAASKLRLIVDLTSANASHQVQQELSSAFERMCYQVKSAKQDLDKEVRELDDGLRGLEETTSQAKLLRNKAGWLMTELAEFTARYLENSV